MFQGSTAITLRAGVIAAALLRPAYATTIVVSNDSDVLNGNITSPAALIANPGSDGISLREAFRAIQDASGPHTITFDPALRGHTIRPAVVLNVVQNDIAILGITEPDGSPAITIDGSDATAIVMFIRASNVVVSHLRFVRTRPTFAISIRAGATGGSTIAPPHLDNIEITDNVFDNSALPNCNPCDAISLGMERQASNAEIDSVTIARNTVTDFTGNADGVLIVANGTSNLIHDIVVSDNRFVNTTFAVELVPAATSGSVIRAVQIVRNTFVGGVQPVNLNVFGSDARASTDNAIYGTWIASNVLANSRGPAIVLLGGATNAIGNRVTNTTIANNMIYGSTTFGGVAVIAGRTGGRLNRIDNVLVVNNTIYNNVGGGVLVNDDPERTSGANTHSGVVVLDSIVVGNPNSPTDSSRKDFAGLTAGQVSYSVVSQSGFGEGAGNITADPQFVNAAQGDFHLQPTSPAIDAGNSSGATLTDLEGNRRIDIPGVTNRGAGVVPFHDIGAFEFGSAPATAASVTVVASGPLTNRTIALTLTPPTTVLDQTGSVFVAVVPADAQRNAVSCDSISEAYSGRLDAELHIPVSADGNDFSGLVGAVVYAGYGIGPTPAAACTDMLNYSTIEAVYTIN